MGSQQYCLRWNNHQSSVMSVFSKLLTNESLVDVTLACEGAKLKAHRVVLSACSPYFQEIFEDNPCQHPVVILKDFTFVELRSLIDFIYKGEVNINQQCLDSFLKTAESLQISGLANVSTEDHPAVVSRTAPVETPYPATRPTRGSRLSRGDANSTGAHSSSMSRNPGLPSVTSLCEVTVDDCVPAERFCSDVIRLDDALREGGDAGVVQITSDVGASPRPSRAVARSRPTNERNLSEGASGSGSASAADCMMQEMLQPPPIKEEIDIVDDDIDFGEDLGSNYSRTTDNQDSVHSELMEELQYIQSQKGMKLLLYHGFTFRRQKQSQTKTIWQCLKYGSLKCKGRAHTENGCVVKSSSHNHLPDPPRSDKKVSLRTLARRRAKAEKMKAANPSVVPSTSSEFSERELQNLWKGLSCAPGSAEDLVSPEMTVTQLDSSWSP